jgi:hypothetical protein
VNEEGVLAAYVTLIDADLMLEGRATISPAEDDGAVGVVAKADVREQIAAVYRARGYSVRVAPKTGALEIRRR